jgi:hypothetical protein
VHYLVRQLPVLPPVEVDCLRPRKTLLPGYTV